MVTRTPFSWKARMYGTWFMPPISGANRRSGETSSSRDPEAAMRSAALMP